MSRAAQEVARIVDEIKRRPLTSKKGTKKMPTKDPNQSPSKTKQKQLSVNTPGDLAVILKGLESISGSAEGDEKARVDALIERIKARR